MCPLLMGQERFSLADQLEWNGGWVHVDREVGVLDGHPQTWHELTLSHDKCMRCLFTVLGVGPGLLLLLLLPAVGPWPDHNMATCMMASMTQSMAHAKIIKTCLEYDDGVGGQMVWEGVGRCFLVDLGVEKG